jgi:hypothetical protein
VIGYVGQRAAAERLLSGSTSGKAVTVG